MFILLKHSSFFVNFQNTSYISATIKGTDFCIFIYYMPPYL